MKALKQIFSLSPIALRNDLLRAMKWEKRRAKKPQTLQLSIFMKIIENLSKEEFIAPKNTSLYLCLSTFIARLSTFEYTRSECMKKKLIKVFALLDVIIKTASHMYSKPKAVDLPKTLSSLFTQCKHVLLTTRAFWLMFREQLLGIRRRKLNLRGFSQTELGEICLEIFFFRFHFFGGFKF